MMANKKPPKKVTKTREEKRQAHIRTKQMAVLQAAIEGGLKENMTKLAARAGVARQTIYGWLNEWHRLYDPEFERLWKQLPAYIVRTSLASAAAALRHQASEGEGWAVKMVMEMSGDYVPPAQKHEHAGRMTLEQLVAGAVNGNGNGKSKNGKGKQGGKGRQQKG